ncbi:hypothetical protein DACRYDRAFT_89447 [Dacryopinax primogenitus]|uniref:Uncharacterized protein n=1 Tax=Dacryopinax primogenitus (strain DJM 731) TaxID=1858805 RepID=M5FYR5_DACPD|nr:uncharacterized protein DACRYDRAFT_89447 [Dacryopinax primogenitus]EJU01045.1 hypothetical protein DACRYDRAFT_89447 [Dacryopinax primogenitus]
MTVVPVARGWHKSPAVLMGFTANSALVDARQDQREMAGKERDRIYGRFTEDRRCRLKKSQSVHDHLAVLEWG